jgi:acyl carrier protein phosphodiesterase
MNHLAHCFLSFGNEDLLVGNFIGDYVKGSAWKNHPEGVQKGILLHRTIDSFTDNHPLARRSKERIRPFAHRYAGPMVDILYDHLLTIYWEKYAAETFDFFAKKTYAQLGKRAAEMPIELQARLPQMLAGRFLHGYQSREGLEWVLGRFFLRLRSGTFPKSATSAPLANFFFDNIEAFSEDFKGFFPDLAKTAREKT